MYPSGSHPRLLSWLVALKSACFRNQTAWLTFTFNNTYRKLFMLPLGNTVRPDILLSCFLALCHGRNATAGRQTRDVIGGYQINTRYSCAPIRRFLHVGPLGIVVFTICHERMESC